MCFPGERREKESESEKEEEEEEGRRKKKQEMQPLVFGRGHLLHSRDCENGRRECVYVCVSGCMCVSLSCPVCVCRPNVCVAVT